MVAPFPSPTATWHDNTYPSISPTRPELSAQGKNVVITGGGTGIGAETAYRFAEAGASRIVLLGRREQPLLDTKASIEKNFSSVSVIAIPADVTNKSSVDAAFSMALGNEKVHVLVSNAAILGPHETAQDVDGNEFLASISVNLGGAVNVAQAFLRYAVPNAVAINVSSLAMHINIAPAFVAYSVSKAAVHRYWDSVGFANPQLSIFHTQPGVVDTTLNAEAGGVAAAGFQDDVSLPGTFHVWLASPEAHFLKGRFVYCNWDVDEMKARAQEIEASQQLTIGLNGWPFSNIQFEFKPVADPGGKWSN